MAEEPMQVTLQELLAKIGSQALEIDNLKRRLEAALRPAEPDQEPVD